MKRGRGRKDTQKGGKRGRKNARSVKKRKHNLGGDATVPKKKKKLSNAKKKRKRKKVAKIGECLNRDKTNASETYNVHDYKVMFHFDHR